jgi:predicted RNA binding protein with dsRBD fold (UPF0201 family)
MTELVVSVRATVNPTESQEKVSKAIRNILGDVSLNVLERGGSKVVEGIFDGPEPLNHLGEVFRRMRIRDAARALLSRSPKEGRLSFGLNKQAAFAGKASFHSSGESPLGPIQITVEGDIESVIALLCGFGVKSLKKK